MRAGRAPLSRRAGVGAACVAVPGQSFVPVGPAWALWAIPGLRRVVCGGVRLWGFFSICLWLATGDPWAHGVPCIGYKVPRRSGLLALLATSIPKHARHVLRKALRSLPRSFQKQETICASASGLEWKSLTWNELCEPQKYSLLNLVENGRPMMEALRSW